MNTEALQVNTAQPGQVPHTFVHTGIGVTPANLIGSSDATRSLRASVARAASRQPMRAIVVGEYGTGRKNIAAAIHCEGPDPQPLHVIDCSQGSAPYQLDQHIENSSAGGACQALLLEAPERLPIEAQLKLAQHLSDVRPAEAGQPLTVLATVRDSIGQLVDQGELSAVLVEALGSLVLVPPLRARAGDIVELVERFVTAMNLEFGKSCTVSPELIDSYRRYAWPGNVRELKRLTATLYHAAGDDGALLPRADLVPELFSQTQANFKPLVGRTLNDVKRALFLETLAHHEGDKRLTASTLGISMKTLYNRMREYRPEA